MIKALILAAGLGTRLKPITDNLPKTMVEVGDKPVIAYVVDNLTHYDIGDIIVNWPAEKNNAIAQKAGINIICPFAKLRLLYNRWN